jgi:hypothetical protein
MLGSNQKKIPLVSMGDKRIGKRAKTVSEDPHWRERKFLLIHIIKGPKLQNTHNVQFSMILETKNTLSISFNYFKKRNQLWAISNENNRN